MKNSIETIIGDMKKLCKDLDVAYGDIKPHLCEIDSPISSCPNKNCWVNRSRNEYFDRVCEVERIALNVIDIIDANNDTDSEKIKHIRTELLKIVTTKETSDNEKLPKVAIQF